MKTLNNFLRYHFGSKTNTSNRYYTMRSEYVSSKGNVINLVSKVNAFLNSKYAIRNSEGVLGSLDRKAVKQICNKIKEDGYFIFPKPVPNEIVMKLREFANNVPLNYMQAEQGKGFSSDAVKYVDAKGKSNRYQLLDISKFKQSPEALQLVTDSNFLHVANEYLNAKPILDLIVMWWSTGLDTIHLDDTSKKELLSKSAQMFHFDMDRLKFLKFFVYLTDVNEKNGPHVYVRGTHNKLPSYINSDGRYPDENIIKNDGKNIVEIVGKAGTIIAVDTRGLHKGKELVEGERLIFQLEFTNSLFGNPSMPSLTEKFQYQENSKFFDTYSYFYKP